MIDSIKIRISNINVVTISNVNNSGLDALKELIIKGHKYLYAGFFRSRKIYFN